jgi:hypothetical protein
MNKVVAPFYRSYSHSQAASDFAALLSGETASALRMN